MPRRWSRPGRPASAQAQASPSSRPNAAKVWGLRAGRGINDKFSLKEKLHYRGWVLMARIFISYARDDGSVIADDLTDELRKHHQVFRDQDNIPGGAKW